MTSHPAEVVKPGQIEIHYRLTDGTIKDFVVSYNPSQIDASVEKVKLEAPEDKGIITKWGDNIYRINLKAKAPKAKDKYSIKVAAK
jgi:hypothetical protein